MSCARGCCDDQATHYKSIRLSATCTPTSRGDVVRLIDKDKAWDASHASYRKLRKAGVQPDTIDSSPQLERELGG